MNPNAALNRLNNIIPPNDDYDIPSLMETYIDTFTSSIESYSRLNSALIDALLYHLQTLEGN